MRFFGIDLAFSLANPSGVSVLAEDGTSIGSSHTYSDRNIADFIVERAHPAGNILVVDAPLICLNEMGQRPCERLVGKYYGKFHASCHSSNARNMAGQRGPALLAELRGKFPISVQHDAQQASPTLWPVIETYPHPGHIEMFDLPRILKYKKGTVDEKHDGLEQYAALLKGLEDRKPALRVETVPLLSTDVGCLRGAALKRHEDLLDALFCAYMALYLWHYREDESKRRVVKEESSPDFITVPLQ